VLARHQAIDGWPGQSSVLKSLWALSESVTPTKRTGEFNQAMMDLGATLCTRTKPDCASCPVADDCQGLKLGDPTRFPGKKPKKDKPVKSTVMLLVTNDAGETLLEKRPPSGIWGGLWSLPEVDQATLGTGAGESVMRFRHTFSHYHLDIEVRAFDQAADPVSVRETRECVWWDNDQELPGGIAAPVAKILTATSGDLL